MGEVRRIAARDQREIYGIIAGPVEGFLRRLGALEQKWRKTDAKVLMECADELRAILGKEQPKQ